MPQISKATEYNWKKLDSHSEDKLTKRANKTQSKKRVIATNYLDYTPAGQLLNIVLAIDAPIGDIMFSLCVSCLNFHKISDKENVKAFISQYAHYEQIDILIPERTWDDNNDVLGFIHQSLTTEGERNLTGQYYTNKRVVDYMTKERRLADGETFLDPCCGSGAFLLSVQTNTPECLFGFDINPIAVMIAGTNLLTKYVDKDFVPHVYCHDFLKKDLFDVEKSEIPFKFDHIYTNPPWGADKEGCYFSSFPEIKSKERSSMVIVESLRRLHPTGHLCFLLPTSLLKIKRHDDIRKYILSHATIQKIDLYSDRFDGVFTDYFSINLSGIPTGSQTYTVSTGDETRTIVLSESETKSGAILVEPLTNIDDSIIQKMESRRHDDLKHSQWALGIVTGDNKNKVKEEMATGLEPVYTGKQVAPFKLLNGSSYILFAPESFQQCAKEEYFRAPEKLIYRFIAKYPIVAYDDKQCLCLNSANILIPKLDGISIKSVAALLNSSLYHYYYSIKFSDIKILKGNLQELPFPLLTKKQDKVLCDLVSNIQDTSFTPEYQRLLDKEVFSIFEISPEEQEQIYARSK